MNRIASILAVLAVAAAAPVMAQNSGHDAHHASAAGPGTAAHDFVPGEVKKVDKEAGKITLKHGPIASLDMPAMTMVYRARDASALTRLKPGDTIRFKAEKIDGNYTITEFEPAS
jgi:Cu(I)/Ag(I) efflux system periplasmic protein CusF